MLITICPDCGFDITDNLIPGANPWLYKSSCPRCNFKLYDKEWLMISDEVM